MTVTAVGAKPLRPNLGENTLKVYVSHPGRSEVLDAAGNVFSTTHLERGAVTAYDVISGRIQTEG